MPWDLRRGIRQSKVSAELAIREGLETEKHLAVRQQVTVKSLASYRRGHLRENYHWVLRNSTVFYTKEGMQEVAHHLGVLEVEPEPVETDTHRIWFGPAFDTPLSPNIVEVVKRPLNPRLLVCRDHEGNMLSVRNVRSTRMFRKGMKIDLERQCRPNWKVNYPDGRRVYDFIGRMPRTYGRW